MHTYAGALTREQTNINESINRLVRKAALENNKWIL